MDLNDFAQDIVEFPIDYRLINRVSFVSEMGTTVKLERLPSLICGKFKVCGDAIACGSFGCVYPAKEVGNDNKMYAIKVEDLVGNEYPQLEHEANMYDALKGGEGVPSSYGCEVNPQQRAVIVMDMLGDSLQHLFFKCNSKFSIKTILMCAEQMISRLQWMHERNFVHRDLKPANFCIGYPGSPDERRIFIMDFE